MALEKAEIQILDGDDKGSIKVLFNPKEYVIEKTTSWKENETVGLDSPEVQFTIGQRKRLSMELFFDTSDEKKDVREHTDKIEKIMVVDKSLHRPPLLLFSWGKLKFKCVLEDLSSRFTMFLDDGTPIRAILKVLFKETETAKGQAEKKPNESADHTKRLILREGESLQSLSAREYGDPKHWRMIAESNGIIDPLNIKSGTILKLPPLF
jgi:hypothetical protein